MTKPNLNAVAEKSADGCWVPVCHTKQTQNTTNNGGLQQSASRANSTVAPSSEANTLTSSAAFVALSKIVFVDDVSDDCHAEGNSVVVKNDTSIQFESHTLISHHSLQAP
jgi:hypothetical protein